MNQLVPLVLFHRALPWKLCSIGTCAFSYKGQECEGKGKGKGGGGVEAKHLQRSSQGHQRSAGGKRCFS